MKINLVGCGGIARCHFESINNMKSRGAVLTAVADIIPERAERTADEFGCNAYTDYVEMLDKEHPDVLHICTPHYLHVPMAVEALSRDINVVLEKPCAVSVESLKEIIEAEKKSNAKLGVCFQNRYNPSVRFAKELIDSGEYGAVTAVRALVTWRRDADYYDADAWRGTIKEECGGVLINQAIHTHDLFKYLSGKTTYSVDGHISNFHLKDEIEVEDTASAYFTFTDSTRGVYFATNAAGSSMSPLIDVILEKGTLRVEGNCVSELNSNGGKVLFSSDTLNQNIVGKKEWGDSHTRLIDDFYDCVQTGRDFEINAAEAGKAVAELLAVYESSKTGNTILMKEFLK